MTSGRTVRALAILGGALLAVGILVDVAWVRPRVNEVRALRSQRDRAQETIVEKTARQHERNALAHALQITDLDSLAARSGAESPLGFLGRTLGSSRVVRLDLTAMETTDSVRIRRSRFSLRVLGTFADILGLLRTLEDAPRLVTVDALSIGREPGSRRLECRLNVSIHDPRGDVAS